MDPNPWNKLEKKIKMLLVNTVYVTWNFNVWFEIWFINGADVVIW